MNLPTKPFQHVRFYTDTEFNSGGGKLLSAALVSSTGHRWYEAMHLPEGVELDYWPRHHVIPVLGKPQITRQEAIDSLHKFISQFDSITLVMDNNTDANHFAKLFEEAAARTLINMEFVRPLKGVKHLSKVPHNALSDAHGLMEAVLGSTAIGRAGVAPRSVYTQLEAMNIRLNAINSEYDFVTIDEQGNTIVKVFPVGSGGTRKTLNRWSDSYDHSIGSCFLTIQP
jgi:hypothetical protein